MKHVLIIRFSSLGDVVIATAGVEACYSQYLDAQIFVLTKDAYCDVFLNNPHVTRVFSVGKKSLFTVIREINEEGMDSVFDLHRSVRSVIASWLIKARIVHYKKDALSRRMLVLFKKYCGASHTVRSRYIACVAEDTTQQQQSMPRLYVTKEEIAHAKEMLHYDSTATYIGVNASARWHTKEWLPERYAALIERITQSESIRVVLLGDTAASATNHAILDGLSPAARDRVIDCTGRCSLRALFAAIRLCRMLITTDSAPLHIAQAQGIPVVALFGPTVSSFGFWEPREHDVLIEKKLSCRPCSLHGTMTCPKKHFRCMRDITVDQVWEKIKLKILNSKL